DRYRRCKAKCGSGVRAVAGKTANIHACEGSSFRLLAISSQAWGIQLGRGITLRGMSCSFWVMLLECAGGAIRRNVREYQMLGAVKGNTASAHQPCSTNSK